MPCSEKVFKCLLPLDTRKAHDQEEINGAKTFELWVNHWFQNQSIWPWRRGTELPWAKAYPLKNGCEVSWGSKMAIWFPQQPSVLADSTGSRVGKDGGEELKNGEVTANKTHSNGFLGRRTALDCPTARGKCLEWYPVRRALLWLLDLKLW